MRAFEFIYEEKFYDQEITGDCWISPKGKIIPVERNIIPIGGDSTRTTHSIIAAKILKKNIWSLPIEKYNLILDDSYRKLLNLGYAAINIEMMPTKNVGTLSFGSTKSMNWLMPDILSRLTPRIQSFDIFYGDGYVQMSREEAEEKF